VIWGDRTDETAFDDCPASTRVVVHRHHRFFREGLADLLTMEDDIEVVATASAAADVPPLASGADVILWDFIDDVVGAMASVVEVARQHPTVRSVAICACESDAQRIEAGGLAAIVPSNDGLRSITGAIRAAAAAEDAPTPTPRWRAAASEPEKTVLTNRETQVLGLVGAGCTTHEISEQLGISRKTVENHTQRIFTKLDVQNQAHAVSVAVKRRLLRIDGVVGLADEA
jgi:DNA-binding NarL/FixJ family response regulator